MSRFLVVVFLIAALLCGGWVWEGMNFAAPGPAAGNGASQTVVDIAPRQSLWRIANQLARAGTVRSAVLFDLGVRLGGESALLKAGEYAIPSGASMQRLAEILISGRVIEHRITAAEGLTSQMIAGLVNADPELSGPLQPAPREGSLLPETYLFTKGTGRGAMLARMHDAQARFLARVWPARAPDLPLRSPGEAVTLASVVEKETAIPEERRHIAAVFINRLRLGMKLESDPTVIYGLSKGYPLGHGIRASELASLTPYNTYAISGLPPTPICNPGKDSIAAVLNPEHSADLYFVADGTGGHAFAASKAEHDRNVARWRQIESAALRLKP
ncbi:MAG TPA: endolytic transglycosylase MltG [Rhizomicrobium sp.]|jgi:UPF0755 protein|nr:endolytic transglycosylase MltG [Rhizomicrobium sp.]